MCLNIAFTVKPAPPKECLKAFGGLVDIKEYRKNFSMIKSYSHVIKFASNNKNMRTDWNGLVKKRFFIFEFAQVEKKTVKPSTAFLEAPRVQVGRAMIIRSNSIN